MRAVHAEVAEAEDAAQVLERADEDLRLVRVRVRLSSVRVSQPWPHPSPSPSPNLRGLGLLARVESRHHVLHQAAVAQGELRLGLGLGFGVGVGARVGVGSACIRQAWRRVSSAFSHSSGRVRSSDIAARHTWSGLRQGLG